MVEERIMFAKEVAKYRAFSLIEMVIVVTIIGIVSAIALPRFASSQTGRRASAAKRIIFSDIEMVKLRARATSKTHIIKFYPADNRYIVFEGTTLNRQSAVLLRDISESPFELGIDLTSLGVSQEATITAYGEVSPAFTVGIEADDQTISIEIAGVDGEQAVVVDEMSVAESAAIVLADIKEFFREAK